MWVTARLQAVCKSKVVCLETANQLDGPLFWIWNGHGWRPDGSTWKLHGTMDEALFGWMKRLDLSSGGLLDMWYSGSITGEADADQEGLSSGR